MANNGDGDQYKVNGYGRQNNGYGGPYLDEADKDPAFEYKYAGDPKKQAQYQKDLKALDKAKKAN